MPDNPWPESVLICPVHGVTTLDEIGECSWTAGGDHGERLGCGYIPERYVPTTPERPTAAEWRRSHLKDVLPSVPLHVAVEMDEETIYAVLVQGHWHEVRMERRGYDYNHNTGWMSFKLANGQGDLIVRHEEIAAVRAVFNA